MEEWIFQPYERKVIEYIFQLRKNLPMPIVQVLTICSFLNYPSRIPLTPLCHRYTKIYWRISKKQNLKIGNGHINQLPIVDDIVFRSSRLLLFWINMNRILSNLYMSPNYHYHFESSLRFL